MVFKLISQLSNFESLKVFSLGQGGLEVIDLGPNTLNGLHTLQLEQQSNIAPGLRSSSYADSFIEQGGLTAGVWYHVVWVLSSPNFTDYTATWTTYINGSSPSANPTASISTSCSSSGTASAASVSNSGSSGLSHGAVAGIVIGAVVGAILLLVLLMVICFGRSRSKGNKLEDHHTTHHGGHDVDDSESPAEVEMGHVTGDDEGHRV